MSEIKASIAGVLALIETEVVSHAAQMDLSDKVTHMTIAAGVAWGLLERGAREIDSTDATLYGVCCSVGYIATHTLYSILPYS